VDSAFSHVIFYVM